MNNRRRLSASILIAGLFCTPSIQAGGTAEAWGFSPDTTLYLGTGLGAANYSNFSDGSGGGKVYGGIRYRAIGAELGYVQTGMAEKIGESMRDQNLERTYKTEMSGLSAAAVGYMPVNVRTDFFGKLGGIYWNQSGSSRSVPANTSAQSESTGLSPILGIGAEYKFYQNMGVRGEWEHIFSTGENEYESDVDLITLGITMSTL